MVSLIPKVTIRRVNKELEDLEKEPRPGVSVWPIGDQINNLEAVIQGPEGSPYEGGVFRLKIEIIPRYPFEPPKIRFVQPIYHPNIDDKGRICLDTLKLPPSGSWKPSVHLGTLLSMLRLLLEEPNPDDPLVPEIASLFKHDRRSFNENAQKWTKRHATADNFPRISQQKILDHQQQQISEPSPRKISKEEVPHEPIKNKQEIMDEDDDF